MEKIKAGRRDIQFFSKKNDKMFIVHDEKAVRYAQQLEDDARVLSYQPCEPLGKEGMSKVDPLNIRPEYLHCDMDDGYMWESNFLIEFDDCTRGIREIVDVKSLKKRAIVEQIELSRRYWAAQGISDWQIVIFQRFDLPQEDADYVY